MCAFLGMKYCFCFGNITTLCFISQSEHHSATLSGIISDRVLACGSLSAAFSAFTVSLQVSHQTASVRAKVIKSSVGEMVSQQIHTKHTVTHQSSLCIAHTPTDNHIHSRTGTKTSAENKRHYLHCKYVLNKTAKHIENVCTLVPHDDLLTSSSC